MLPHILTPQSLSILIDGAPTVIPRSHINFDEILEHVNDNDPTEILALINPRQAISSFTSGRIEVNDRVLTYNGRELTTSLARKIVEFIREGQANLAQPLINFLDKVMLNPSYQAGQRLFDWVSASGMPIHPDGDILAWKIVRADYLDYHTGTLDHSPGKIVEQPRNECDEDPDRTCSSGIHFCSFAYLPAYHRGDSDRRVMLVKINPADVVAIPRDYGNAKGRCCRLVSVEEVPQDKLEDFFPTTTVFYQSVAVREYRGGQVWRDDIGNDYLVTKVSDYGVTLDIGGNEVDLDDVDLVELVSDAAFDFSIGKRFIYRDGAVREVRRLSSSVLGVVVCFNDDEMPRVWAESGRVYLAADVEHPRDVLRPVIDWNKPLVDTNGAPVELHALQHDIAMVKGHNEYTYWWHHPETGEHLYNNRPGVRNVP